MSEKNPSKQFPSTLCWNCRKATGGCSWSERLKPVKGWKALGTKRTIYGGEYKSFLVLECPEFIADSYRSGLKRFEKDG